MSSRQNTGPTVALEFLDRGQIAIVTLTDKSHGNAMSPKMGDAFRAVVERLKAAIDLRAAIVQGDGKDFSIGGARQMLSRLALESDGRRQAESYGTEEFRRRIANYLPDRHAAA